MRARILIPAILVVSALHAQTGIEGDITPAKALKWLYPESSKATAKTIVAGDSYIEVYTVQQAMVNGEPQWYLCTTAVPKDERERGCHACSVMLGAAMFARQGGRWIERANNPELAGVGSFSMPPEKRTAQWGKQAYGLVLHDGWVGSGVISGFETLYGLDRGSFRIIFTLPVYYSNGASLAEDKDKFVWEATWSFRPPASNGIFDVVVKMKSDDRRAHTVAARERGEGAPEPGVYRYDGKVYRHVRTHTELGK